MCGHQFMIMIRTQKLVQQSLCITRNMYNSRTVTYEGRACTVHLILDPLCPSQSKEKNQMAQLYFFISKLFIFVCLVCAFSSKKFNMKMYVTEKVSVLQKALHELNICQGKSTLPLQFTDQPYHPSTHIHRLTTIFGV